MGQTNVFISHKHENEAAAKSLKGIIELYGGKGVRVFISEDIPPGTDWFEWIRKSLASSNLLLLLFTEPSADWDWPLYEAGLFTSLEGDDTRRVVCLHRPDQSPPKPLKHLQAVPAKPAHMKSFLRSFFGGTEITAASSEISLAFASNPKLVEQTAHEICAFFRPHEVVKRHYDRYLDVTVADPDALTEESVPPDTMIRSDLRTLEVFGLAGDQVRWKDIERQAKRAGDDRWLRSLAHSLFQAKDRQFPDPVFDTFTSKRGDVVLRPEVFRSDEVSDGSMVFHVLLIEELSANLANVPTGLRDLSVSLRFAFRFRWEVLAPHAHDNLTKEDLDAIEAALHRIESEAAADGLVDVEAMASRFGKADAERFLKMLENWGALHNPEATGTLDVALKNGDTEEVGKILQSLVPLNREYVEMVARRFADEMAAAA